MNFTELCAYTAGFIDGEGCIYYHISGGGTKKQKNPSATIKVFIASTHFPVIELLHNEWGGYCKSSITYHSRQKENNKNQIRITFCGDSCIKLLEYILPFLLVKREEALVALEIKNLPKGNKYKETPKEILESRELIHKKLKELKNYSFSIPTKKIKIYKKDMKSKCKTCSKEMPKYNLNGIEKVYCCKKCLRGGK